MYKKDTKLCIWLMLFNNGDKIRLRYFDNDLYYVRYMEKIETPKEEKEEDPFEW